MSLIGALGNAISGMHAIQADLQVVSSNVSNAGREDYTRKKVNISSNSVTTEGTGGVRITGYSRSTSETVSKILNQSLAENGLRGTQKSYLQQVQDLLGASKDTPVITSAMSSFTAAWQELAAAPEDNTRKQNVIFKAQNLAREVQRLANGIDAITTNAQDEVTSSVNTLNISLARIAELNIQIASAEHSGGSSGSLIDERDVEVRKVSALTAVNVVPRGQNGVGLYTPGGLALLDLNANTFVWNGTTITQGGTDVTASLSGGKIEALVGVLDQGSTPLTLNDPGKATLYKLNQQLDQITSLFTNVAGTFAIAYDGAATGVGELASGFFTGTSRYNFAINTALINGTSQLKQASASIVAADTVLSNRTINAGNISLVSASYTSFTDAIIYTNSQNSKQIADRAALTQSQQDDYSKRLKDEVGVNVDEEIVRLTQLQNNYAASARVISTVQQLFEVLNRL
jgi:flagellar hook-associated protein 1